MIYFGLIGLEMSEIMCDPAQRTKISFFENLQVKIKFLRVWLFWAQVRTTFMNK